MSTDRLTFGDETDARSRTDRENIRAWNDALAAAERKAGDGLVWEQGGRGWGTLVTAHGRHLAYGVSAGDALRAFART